SFPVASSSVGNAFKSLGFGLTVLGGSDMAMLISLARRVRSQRGNVATLENLKKRGKFTILFGQGRKLLTPKELLCVPKLRCHVRAIERPRAISALAYSCQGSTSWL